MLADSWSTITGRERPNLRQSFRSLAIREGQVVADSRRSGTPHQRVFLCPGNGNFGRSRTFITSRVCGFSSLSFHSGLFI